VASCSARPEQGGAEAGRIAFTRWGEYDCNWLDDERVVCAENQTTHRWLLSRRLAAH
jgi:hypothetical protein